MISKLKIFFKVEEDLFQITDYRLFHKEECIHYGKNDEKQSNIHKINNLSDICCF